MKINFEDGNWFLWLKIDARSDKSSKVRLTKRLKIKKELNFKLLKKKLIVRWRGERSKVQQILGLVGAKKFAGIKTLGAMSQFLRSPTQMTAIVAKKLLASQ